MSIRVTCQKCGAVLKVKEELAGTKGKCPTCRGTLHVPTLEEAAAQAAAGPLGSTETSAAASAGDTGALKVPTKTKTPKVAAASDQPPPEANGSAAAHAPSAEAAPPASRMELPPPAPPAESSTDDLAEANGEARPKAEGKSRLTMPEAEGRESPKAEKSKGEGKQKLRMSDTDAEEGAPPSETPTPPKAKSDPKGPSAEAESAKPAKSDKDEFDLDSFLMEGPKPKAMPPAAEETPGKKGPAARPGSGRRLSMSDDETNVPGPSETLPPPNKSRGSAAESAVAALGGSGTASSAKDLLARATQEGRARAAQMPEEAREGIDFKGAFKAIFQQYGLQTVGTVVLCAVLYFSMSYMMSDSADLPPLARVYGKVTLKGAPLPGVIVHFTPVGSKDSKEGGPKVKKGAPRAASGVTDKDGHFELMYMEGIRGAVVGQNRVWIAPQAPEDFKKVPGNYQSAGTSGDIREIKETGGEQNIDLK